MRSKAGGIFGIVGGSLMMFGCVTTAIMALSVLAALARHSSYSWPETTYDFVGLMVSPFVFVAGGTLGLAGGLKALKKDNKFGAKLMFAAAAFAVVAGVLLIAPTMFLPFAVLIAGGVLSFIFVQPPQQPREEYRDRYLPPPYIPPALPPYGSPYFPPYGAPYAPPPVYPQDPPEPFGEFGMNGSDDSAAGSSGGENAGASGGDPGGSDGSSDGGGE